MAIDENGHFSYVPEESGDLLIDVHAADKAGNNTDFQLTVPVISLDLVTEKRHTRKMRSLLFSLHIRII